ncbi:MAG: hypothetical protein SNJ73_10335 [Acetobacteraceae bacterium]
MRPTALALAALALAGCGEGGLRGGGTVAAAPVAPVRAECPEVGGIAEAADLRRYRSDTGQDLTDLVLEARLTGVSGRCEYMDRRRRDRVRVTLTLALEVTRGPAAQGRTLTVPYFVAVADSEARIPSKQVFEIPVEFPANRTRLRVSGEEVTVDLPLGAGRQASDYTVLVGFQLNEQELALNRRIAAARPR